MGNKLSVLLGIVVLCPAVALAATADSSAVRDKIVLTGSAQSDVLIPTGKQDDGSNEDFRTNTYLELNATSNYVDAGLRYEYLEHPLPGFENDFKGNGFPYFYIKGKLKNNDLTLGHFYEQFGSGFILRTYEERSLGIDNSLLGARLVLRPFNGVQLKALTGKQRRYWHENKALISGADLELSLDQWFKALQNHDYFLTLGGSWVNKHDKPSHDVVYANPTHQLVLPENVNAFDGRVNLVHDGWNVLAEYAYKTQDPIASNNWIYRKGYVAMLSTSYSHRGFSVLAQAKRSDNFSFRSRRDERGTSSYINHLPAFTQDQTYTLPAMYPYATNPLGEWAYQAQLGYKFKRHTLLGGHYGTDVKVNFSHVHSIDKSNHALTVTDANNNVETFYGAGTNGYGSAFWKWGKQTYYQDINVQMEHRFTSDFKLSLMYMNQLYNKTAVEGEGGTIHSNIVVADALFSLSPGTRLRTELQYLNTKQDKKDWLFALAELSVTPHWMFTASDEYNAGTTHAHYWLTAVTYNWGAHRVQVGWGRTRAGFNCSGGVCRYVPETKGFTISYNWNF